MNEESEGKREQAGICINVRRLSPNATVVEVSGELTGNGAAAMHRKVADELTASSARMILDLSAVTRFDVGGIDALTAALGIAGEADIAFCLVEPSSPVSAALAASDLADLFEVFPSVDDAISGRC